MSDSRVHKQATEASAEEGIVMLDGPDGVAVSMTADAAELSSARIRDAAAEARAQQPGTDEASD